MKNKKIIISGAPGTGKTTIINELKNKGYECAAEINPLHSDIKIRENKLLMSEFLFDQRTKQHDNINKSLVFYDRSIIDVVAYMKFWKHIYPIKWNSIIQESNYFKSVFYTPLWQEIYITNKYRKETYQEAQKIDIVLQETFSSFNYKIIHIPKLKISERVQFIINNI
tara:strand:+ start:108 stop:611 length:504 start_codon:yes stop_codon:yes gene_type:complete